MTNKTILMVDDSETALVIQRVMLNNTGLQVHVARDGKRGVELAVELEPDLILMDVVMPEMTGFEAVRRIREHPRLRDTPIIMVTARGESANINEGFNAGCTAYINKPFNANELRDKILSELGPERGDGTRERVS